MPTLKDIAAVCKVHVSTVSRALKNYPEIPEETRSRIRETARLMGYGTRPEPAEKKKTSRIGVLYAEGSGSSMKQAIFEEIRKSLMGRGYDLVLLHPLRAEGGVQDAPGYLAKARLLGLEGVILLMHLEESMLYQTERHVAIRDLLLSEIPVVVLDSCVGPCRCVLPGYAEGMHALVSYIRQKGHERIALVRGIDSVEEGRRAYAPDWAQMFRDALQESHGRVPGNLVKSVEAENAAASYFATMELLQDWRWVPPTCIVYTDDNLLQGGLEALTACEARIPEDISVAAIRFAAQRREVGFEVTSWYFDPASIAEEAVKKLLALRRAQDLPENRIGIVSGRLSAGSTVRPIRVPDFDCLYSPGSRLFGITRKRAENLRQLSRMQRETGYRKTTESIGSVHSEKR